MATNTTKRQPGIMCLLLENKGTATKILAKERENPTLTEPLRPAANLQEKNKQRKKKTNKRAEGQAHSHSEKSRL